MNTKENSMIYIAGRYTGADFLEVDQNIAVARGTAALLAKAGVPFYCPHTHSAHFDVIVPEASYDYWMDMCLRFLANCKAATFLPTWERSTGARIEHKFCEENGILRFYNPQDAIAWWNSLPEAA